MGVNSKSSPKLFTDERAGAIYRTAAAMIYEKGFEATSMSAIAEAVNLTKPGLYYYVKGKKELLFDLMSFAMDLLDHEVVEPARPIVDAETRLRTIVHRHALLLTREPSPVGILIDETRSLTAAQRTAIERRKRAYFDLVRQTLQTLQDEKKMRPVDATVAAFSLLGMVMWISRWYTAGGRMPSEAVAENITEIAVGAVLHDHPPAGLDVPAATVRASVPV